MNEEQILKCSSWTPLSFIRDDDDNCIKDMNTIPKNNINVIYSRILI